MMIKHFAVEECFCFEPSSEITNGFEAEELLDLDKVVLRYQRCSVLCSERSGGALTSLFPQLNAYLSPTQSFRSVFFHLFCTKKCAQILHEKYEAFVKN